MTLLLQETGKLFGLLDEGERERARSAPGLRAVVEVLKSRVSVSDLNYPETTQDIDRSTAGWTMGGF